MQSRNLKSRLLCQVPYPGCQQMDLIPFKWLISFHWFFFFFTCSFALVAQLVKNLPAVQETRVQPLGWEDPLEKEMTTHSGVLAWKISWTEEPGGLQSMGSQRVGHDWATNTYLHLGWGWDWNRKQHFSLSLSLLFAVH